MRDIKMIKAPYSLHEKQKIRNKKAADKLAAHIAVEARKEVHKKLINWAVWHVSENINELDRDSGAIKENLLDRLIKYARGERAEGESTIDEDCAIAMNEAILRLNSSKAENEHVWIIHMIYLEQMDYEAVADELKVSKHKVKRMIRDMRDRMVELLT